MSNLFWATVLLLASTSSVAPARCDAIVVVINKNELLFHSVILLPDHPGMALPM